MFQASPSQDEIAQELVLRERQIALLQLEASVLACQLLENGFLEDAGFNSPTDWLRFNCHLTDKVASDRIQVGEQLAAMRASVEAMRAGEIGYGHLTVMAWTAEAVGKRFEESQLLPLARKHNLVLLCRRHHRMVHEGGWQLIKTESGQIITIAPSSPFMGKSPP